MANVIISGITEVSEIVQMVSRCSRSVAKMADNKMEQVAAMFGKELKERFCIIRYGDRYDARFLERGFEVYGLENPYVDMDSFVLMDLLTGRVEIVEDEK
jgi:hypothetical protein